MRDLNYIKKNSINTLLLILTILSSSLLYAQNQNNLLTEDASIKFRQLTMKEGLADGWVHDALMDSKGIMWFATHDGLSRYDGHHFKNYKVNNQVPNSLPGSVLMGIGEGENGIYWIACNGLGLVKFNSKEETFSLFSNDSTNVNSISGNSATTIFIDADQQIWIGTFGTGLNRLDPSTETFTRYAMTDEAFSPDKGFMENSVRHIIADPQDSNKLWIVTNVGFLHFDKTTGAKKIYPLNHNGIPAFASHAIVDAGTIWVATDYNGLVEFDIASEKTTFHSFDVPVRTVLQKSADELWIATTGKGIGIFNKATHQTQFINKENSKSFSILSNDVYGMYLDPENRLWVRDQYLGVSVSKSTGTLFRQPQMTQSVKDALLKAKQFSYSKTLNHLFVSSYNDNRIFIFEKKGDQYQQTKWVEIPIPNDFNNRVLDIFTDSKNITWVLINSQTEILLYQYNPTLNIIEPFLLPELNDLNAIQQKQGHLLEDRQGRIWLSFATGELWGLNNGKLIKKHFGKNLPNNKNPEIWKVIVDKENNFWAASLVEGVFHLNQKNDTEVQYPYQLEGGLQGWRILTIAEMPNGKMWVGTSAAGIQEIDPKLPIDQKMPIYDQNIGLPDDKIQGIITDPNGNAWVLTMRGLIQYISKTKHFKLLGREDGLEITSLEYGYEQLSNGDIMIGQPAGFLYVTPSKTNNNNEPHSVTLSSLTVNNKAFPTQPSLQHIDKIELEATENYFSLQFSANYFDNPDKVRYQYFLENYDRDWTTTLPGVAQANFTNVPAGNYIFKIIASDSDGNWNKTPLELPIVIHPQWYWTTWMKCIYALLLAGLLALFWIFQNKRWRLQQQLQLEQVEASRLKELDSIKSRFFANVSHELRTPLTLILGPISTMLKSKELSNKQLTLLKTAQQNGKSLLKLVGSILDLSKIESGKFSLSEEPQMLFPFVRRIVSNFESHAERSGIKFIFEYEIPKESSFEIDSAKMEIIFNNLLSNALKFTSAGGRVIFKAKDLENVLQFSIQDTGRGIHEEDIPFVFERFYQSKLPDAPTEGGTGIGLAVSQEYLKLMNGKIWVESEYGQGSIFHLQIPRKEVMGQAPHVDTSEVETTERIGTQPSTEIIKNLPKASTILVVEDNYSLRNYLEVILSEKHNIILAANGQVALDILTDLINNNQSLPDLVLSDIMMPVMDGYQLLKILRSKDYFRPIPVVMLTARADIQDKLTALRIGVDDYLLKPFEEEELLIRIDNLLKNYAERKTFQPTPLEIIETSETVSVEELPSEAEVVKEEKTISQADQEWLETLEKTVLEYLSDSRFNMDFLGEKMFSSRRQIQRRLKKIVGLTPKEYIKEIRLFEARKLLETGQVQSVKATAIQVGFIDIQYFSTQFKERYGKVPSAYLE